MSTRCQVQIIQRDGEDNNMVTLYHHSDGYPEYMIPCIQGARKIAERVSPTYKIYQLGRSGKVAGFLCCADPGGFDVEVDNDLREDIEFLYTIDVTDPRVWFVSMVKYANQDENRTLERLPSLVREYRKEKYYKPVLRLVKRP